RSPRFFAVACRRQSNNEIVVRRENVETMTAKWQWLNKPFLRGTLALVDSMVMGYKALMYAANIQMADEMAAQTQGKAEEVAEEKVDQTAGQSVNGIAIGATVFLALAFALGLFWVVPTLLTQLVQHAMQIRHANAGQSILLNLGDGVIRIAIFLGYVLLISRMAHVKRLFQYHGAEHKAINALEAGKPLTLENARESSRIHPRCGTNFIFIVLIVGIIVYSFFGRPPVYIRVPLHLLLLPVVAGISFEVLKFAGKYRNKKWAQWLVAPGLATQYLTTRVPEDSQIEVALAALSSVWEKEHEVVAPAPVAVAAEAPEPASAVA
ncbi:MAG TPA: DUF1385 domain-containing protein, partial [Capsulimonadaceae bacterium]|nr:DUF1385 domain-containing protein [Capsulimonadaceae bacterium]